MGFTNPDADIADEIADSPIALLRSVKLSNSGHIPHLFQDITVLHLPAIGVSLLSHVPVQPDTLIGGLVQAAGKDGVTAHVGPESFVVATDTVGTAQ